MGTMHHIGCIVPVIICQLILTQISIQSVLVNKLSPNTVMFSALCSLNNCEEISLPGRIHEGCCFFHPKTRLSIAQANTITATWFTIKRIELLCQLQREQPVSLHLTSHLLGLVQFALLWNPQWVLVQKTEMQYQMPQVCNHALDLHLQQSIGWLSSEHLPLLPG